jgi:signal transduction histidine kinase
MSVDVMTGGAAGAAGGRVRVGAGAAPVVVAMRGPGGGPGRWEMFVRHRAGSLEAVVSQARRRNLAVAGAVLLLMLASAGALMRYTRQAQKLAELQMDFVAGVSHELRTPLTVLRTAAYNLRGAVAQNPAQVERYGALIQQQTARLGDLVDQVLQFASAKAGRLVRDSEPVSVEALVEDSLAAVKPALESSRCVVEKSVAPDLPQVVGDRNALRQALENLLSNAVKYGTQGSDWIGISAARDSAGTVEIRVADRGPGIPASEQEQIFDPFFRGKRAIQEQIHGTGLGLSLAKETILAHGGTITVHSEPAKGTEFVIRIPVAPAEYRHEHAHTSG